MGARSWSPARRARCPGTLREAVDHRCEEARDGEDRQHAAEELVVGAGVVLGAPRVVALRSPR
eukprot:7762907-Alexandrium_andersonii.AAC.1